jgi:ABC transporter substrate binding protein (PQQ-dependent alcohol dehydrogenase system)
LSYLGRAEPPVEPLSLVEPILKDEGIQGARLGVMDDQTTGRFQKKDYNLVEHIVPENGDLGAAFAQALDAGERLFVVDLKADELMSLAPAAEKAGAILLDSRTNDDDLRTDKCSKAVFHTSPSYAMKADALAQYMAVKRWSRWFLIRGSLPPDIAYANAVKRSAKKFGMKIVDEREYKYVEGSRRTDTGIIQIQGQIPVFTQGAPDYDVAVVADESDVFGEYIPYHTWDPRPVVGTVGLVPTAWSRVHEQWGGTQLQRRFEKQAGRWMTERDYNAWVAARAVSEAVTRTQTADPAKLRDYMLSDKFELGAFKGQGLSFRRWDQQLREPLLLVTPRMLVSVSPQDQFLHQRTPLDTLGFDEPESKCHLNG